MVIDFHTHVFPNDIALQTVSKLESSGGIEAYTDGTLDGLKKSMEEAEVSISVVLPVATKPSQFRHINDFAASINGKDGILSFGGIHPDDEEYAARLDEIKALGLKGIKLHPDYQGVYIDDERNMRIIEYAISIGLIVVIHAGLDIGLPEPFHCTPRHAANMLNVVERSQGGRTNQIVLAHTGGFGYWNLVEEELVGRNVLFDISYSLGFIKEEQLVRIIRRHGSKKILFGTDSPWGGQKEMLQLFRKLPLEETERRDILSGNALRLLEGTPD